jgi:hypothetical protein
LLRIRAAAFVVLAVLAAGAVAGCGGDGGGPSKQDFADKADKICADVTKRVSALNSTAPSSVADLTNFIELLKKTVKGGITRLQALETPKGETGATAKQFTETLDREYKEQVLPALNQLERAVVKRDKKALKAASKRLKQAQNQKSNQLAAQLGATRCATS